MKRLIRYVSFIMAAVILLTTPAFAAEAATPRASNYIMRTCVYLDETGIGQFDVWYEVIALGQMEEVGACEIKVQRSSDGKNWKTMRTYTPDSYPSMVKTNSIAHAGHVYYTGTCGYYYRAYIVLFAKNGAGRGEVPTYTEKILL